MTKVRWVLVVTADEGMMQSYGPWYNVDIARKHFAQLHSRGFNVALVTVDRWPGLKVFSAS